MRKTFLVSLFLTCLTAVGATEKADFAKVVPAPDKISYNAKGGDFTLSASTVINYTAGNADMERNATFLAQYVKDMTKLELGKQAAKGKAKTGISLVLNAKAKLAPEAYEIVVDKRGVTVTGATAAGVFYGVQAIRKSLPVLQSAESVELPAAKVEASPRFAYRGMMLDCARHFFPAKFVKKYIDLIALHNMNRLHWHISDDQGWRFSVPGYPRLAEVGSKRAQTVTGHNSELEDGVPYGGYYTEDRKSVV